MSTSRRFKSPIKLLMLPLLVGLGACQEDFPTFGATPFSRQELEEYQEDLIVFMQSPCDTEVFNGRNEVHDCQRFIRFDGGDALYGSLIGIMPAFETIEQPAAYYAMPRLSARITNAGGGLELGDRYVDDGYRQLGIGPHGGLPAYETDFRPTGYCLWLHDAGVEDGWRAAIVPIPNPEDSITNCGEPPDTSAWEPLQVTRQTYGSVPDTLYPNTARWQWTSPGDLAGEHYIGIKCGDGWCAITGQGVAPQPIPSPDDEPNWRKAIPGWYDAQFLAVGDAGALLPGPWGEVHPTSTPSTPWSAGYATVANFVLTGDTDVIGRYESKLGLDQVGSGPTWESLLQIETMGPTLPPLARYQNQAGLSHDSEGVTTAGDGHGAHHSARWRWHREDETTWVPCPDYGCCDIGRCEGDCTEFGLGGN